MLMEQNQFFDAIKKAVLLKYPTANIQKEYQPINANFPAVSYQEIRNVEIEHTLDYSERKSNIALQIDIYCDGSKKESICRNIALLIGTTLENIFHMTRQYSNPTPNIDGNVYRYTMRYSFNIDEDSERIYS